MRIVNRHSKTRWLADSSWHRHRGRPDHWAIPIWRAGPSSTHGFGWWAKRKVCI
jgi:hypothetical protein